MKFTALLAGFVLVCSMTAFAAENAPETTAAGAKPAQEKKAEFKRKGHHRNYHRNHYRGEVTAVDAKTGAITVSRGEKTFTADEKLLSGVKVGDRVSVKFEEKDGKLTATGIRPAKAYHHKKAEQQKPVETKAEEKK